MLRMVRLRNSERTGGVVFVTNALTYSDNARAKFIGSAAAALSLVLFCSSHLWAAQKYDVTGLLLHVDHTHRSISVSCREIPGYMDAMVMEFPVRGSEMVETLEPGATVEFSLVVEKDSSYGENVRVHPFESLELDPTEARRFKLMEQAMAARSAADVLHVGQPVTDFSLTDENWQRVSLSQFSGKVVAITFIYTRCPRPDYCVRLSNNFGLLQRRFQDKMGKDLVLLTVVIDPDHDQPEALAKYARIWKADGRSWRFLTGPLPDIQRLCRKFDMAFYPDEGLLVHSFHTVVIDRSGRLAANLEGNDFSAQQLGDLVQSVMMPTQEASSK
jgi:protein SCO1/2